MYHKPNLMNEEFQEIFRKNIVWADQKEADKRFIAWMQGETGYKIVDAAMRQLAQTGQMHNRARMIVASVLTKNLGVDWRWGQEYFRAMLLDLDEASNNGGWQWGASVGADPKPIRIFNPYLQAKNYDADGVYQKRWLGDIRFNQKDNPLIEHAVAREEALKRYGLSKEDGLRDF
jgi:deoxyribodipyrimidine photo-lyase